MPMKEWFRQLQPMQLYIILTLTVAFFITELVISHVTHALTLLMDSYHTLCNIFALSACMITVKYGKDSKSRNEHKECSIEDSSAIVDVTVCSDKSRPEVTCRGKQQENKLKNTFGWARIDVIGMLICCVFLASLCFSILVEALQTLVHIDHHDEMHHPIPVLCIGTVGLFLNGICYLVIGGYTFHQGSFLYMTESGCVVLNRVVTNDSVCRGERRLSRTRTVPPPQYRQRQGCRETFRDIVGCVFVIICAILVYFTEQNVAKYIDPILSLISASVLMILSFPYMRESCLILLQTIPDTINIDSLRSQLLQHFPDIVNVHDLHVWQLTATKVISTAHIIFQNPTVYLKITDKLTEFFLEHGITQVTIQPEFFIKTRSSSESLHSHDSLCLMQCQSEGCKTSHCCPENQQKMLTLNSKWKSLSKELVACDSPVDLKFMKINTREFPNLTNYEANDSYGSVQKEEQINRIVQSSNCEILTAADVPIH